MKAYKKEREGRGAQDHEKENRKAEILNSRYQSRYRYIIFLLFRYNHYVTIICLYFKLKKFFLTIFAQF